MFSQTLPVDWHSARRFEYHSDGDDDYKPFPGAREPPETAFRSSGYGDGKGLHALFLASGRQGKGIFSGKLTAYPSSSALQQHTGPLRLAAGPFSGPLKATGKPNMAPSIIPADAVGGKKKPCFDANEPTSPEVTCLGRVRINGKYMNGAAEEKPCAEGRKPEHGKVSESKKQSDDRKCKARKKKGAGEKVRCLNRTRRRASREATEFAQADFHTDLKHLRSALPAAEPSETVETRRERAATLARSLTSLLEDMHRFEKEDTEYVPPVPPPNSLLLMRGFRKVEKPPEHASVSQLKMKKTTMADENGFLCRTKKHTMVDEHVLLSEIKMKSRNNLAEQVSLSEMKMEKNTMAEHVALSQMDTEVNYAIVQQAPLSEIKNNAMAKQIPWSEMKNKAMDCCQVSLVSPDPGATLWQRRAIAKLAAIEIKKANKMEVNKPSTK